jgi:hypothetical protein
MQRFAAFAAVLAISLIPLVGGTALAHGDKQVTVTPLSPRAGETVTVNGGGLGDSREVDIRVVGLAVDVDLGQLTAADDGDFSGPLQLPVTIKPGTYQIRAIGDETLETQVTIAPAAPGTSTQAATTQSTTTGGMAPEATETARQRPFGESAMLVGIFGAIAALGLLFSRTARRERANKPA